MFSIQISQRKYISQNDSFNALFVLLVTAAEKRHKDFFSFFLLKIITVEGMGNFKNNESII